MKPTQDIISKIRKCLNLANGLNATQGEIDNAMAKAKAIALRHNIELASINMNEEEKGNAGAINIEKDSTLRIRSQYQQPYHRWIYAIMEEVFEVKVIISGHSSYNGKVVSTIHLIGESTDVAIAKEIFPWLEQIFPRILSKAVSAGKLSYCAAHTNGCYRGIYFGILEMNRREKAKLTPSEASCMALVLVRKEDLIQRKTEEVFPDLKKARKSSCRFNPYAELHGYQEGSKLRLNQVGASQKSSQIK